MSPLILGSNYTGFLLGCIFAPAVKVAYKKQMAFGALMYSCNFSTGIYISSLPKAWLQYLVAMTISALAGASGGLLWTSQGIYLHLVCEKNEISDKEKGKYFSIFNGIYSSIQLTAGFITTFAMGLFNKHIYFMTITLIGVLSAFFCLLTLQNHAPVRREQVQIK